MGSHGFKVSEPDYDVREADDKNLSLKSGLTLLKVALQGTITLNAAWKTINHNLGYVPQFLVFLKDTGWSPVSTFLGTGDLDNGLARADENNLYIGRVDASRTEAIYYIFYEPAQTGTAPSYTPTNDFGMKISKDGVDIDDANILEQTFNSELNSLKIVADGTLTSTASGAREVTYVHGLSVVPGYFAFYEVNNSGVWYPTFTSHNGVDIVECRTDADDFTALIYTSGSKTVKVRYFILADPGQST